MKSKLYFDGIINWTASYVPESLKPETMSATKVWNEYSNKQGFGIGKNKNLFIIFGWLEVVYIVISCDIRIESYKRLPITVC